MISRGFVTLARLTWHIDKDFIHKTRQDKISRCHGNDTYVNLTIRKKGCVVNFHVTFLETKGSRVLEKKVNEKQQLSVFLK